MLILVGVLLCYRRRGQKLRSHKGFHRLDEDEEHYGDDYVKSFTYDSKDFKKQYKDEPKAVDRTLTKKLLNNAYHDDDSSEDEFAIPLKEMPW